MTDEPFDPAPLMDRLRPRLAGGRFRFAVFSDTHHADAFGQVRQMVRRMDVDFALALGDLVDVGAGPDAPAQYATLAEQAGDFLRALPVWPALGNHDADGPAGSDPGGAGGKASTLQNPISAGPDDSYAGRGPRTGRYVLHTPDRDRSWDAQQYFFTLVDVDGPAVTGRTASTTGQSWETFTIRPGAPGR